MKVKKERPGKQREIWALGTRVKGEEREMRREEG